MPRKKKINLKKSEIETDKNQEETVQEEENFVQYRRREHRPSFIGAFLLISIGSLLIANNFGLIDWKIWDILWKFWPVILILVGIRSLLGRHIFFEFITGILTVVVFALIIGYALALTSPEVNKWFRQHLPPKYHHFIPYSQ